MEIIKTFWICRDLEVSSVVNAIQLLIYLPDPEDEGGRVGEEGRVSHDVHSQWNPKIVWKKCKGKGGGGRDTTN